jgi:long-chain fatty acid transport protein
MRKLLFLMVLLTTPVLVHASGYALYEMSARAHGMAHAYIVRVDDPSAVWYNPAALTRVEGTELYGSATWINTSGDVTSSATGQTTEAVEGNFFPPNIYVGHQLSDNWVFGLGVYVPFGLKTEWPERSLPSFVSQKAELKTFFFTPSVGYKITPNISVGGGLDLVYADVGLERNISLQPLAPVIVFNEVNADTFDVGFNLGALIETNANVDFAVTYKNKIDLNLEGDTLFTGVPGPLQPLFPDGGAAVDLPLPGQFMFGIATTYEKLSIEGNFVYSFWDTFEILPLDFENNTVVVRDQAIRRNYEDSWAFRIGAEYSITDQIDLRGGYVYDDTPVVDRAVDPILPDGARNLITFGAGYSTEGWSFDIAYMALFQDDRVSPIDNFIDPPGNAAAAGLYTNSANLLSFGFGYKF